MYKTALCLSKGIKPGGRKQEVNWSTLWNLPLPPGNKPTKVSSSCLGTESNSLVWNFFESQVRKKSSATYLLPCESIYANTSIKYATILTEKMNI